MGQFSAWLNRILSAFWSHAPIGAGRPRSPKWPAVRAAHLRRFGSCSACGRTANLEVHHVIPFQVDPALELHPDNLITLCADPCHLIFGHLMSWSSWNEWVRADSATYLNRIRNRPKTN